jgi:uncharacterized protein (DUF2252 family)
VGIDLLPGADEPPPPSFPTPAERTERGKVARAGGPRSSHADWAPAAVRPDPVDILEAQAKTRIQDLVPIRYGRMLASPFAFYRGAAAVMAADLRDTPVTGIRVQASGDAHLSNFGIFASPERAEVFDINDFDETLPGPWEWDIKRLAASLAIAGRENGFTREQRDGVTLASVASYRTAMASFAAMRNVDVWYAVARTQQGLPVLREALSKKDLKAAKGVLAKARRRDSMHAFGKLTQVVDGERRIVSDPPLVVPIEELISPDDADRVTESLRQLILRYGATLNTDRQHLLESFRLVHVAHKVVGVGSVGTQAWILLCLGRDDEDPLFLQAKEAQTSVLAPYVGASDYENQGQRVVEGQRLMQATSDIFLGWDQFTDVKGVARDYYLRQLRDRKGAWAPETMNPSVMTLVGRLSAWTLARAHARSGDRIAIASYLGKGDVFDRAITAFAEIYADQNERDHAALQRAADEGRIEVRSGV